jgi:hypothetical protein
MKSPSLSSISELWKKHKGKNGRKKTGTKESEIEKRERERG